MNFSDFLKQRLSYQGVPSRPWDQTYQQAGLQGQYFNDGRPTQVDPRYAPPPMPNQPLSEVGLHPLAPMPNQPLPEVGLDRLLPMRQLQPRPGPRMFRGPGGSGAMGPQAQAPMSPLMYAMYQALLNPGFHPGPGVDVTSDPRATVQLPDGTWL